MLRFFVLFCSIFFGSLLSISYAAGAKGYSCGTSQTETSNITQYSDTEERLSPDIAEDSDDDGDGVVTADEDQANLVNICDGVTCSDGSCAATIHECLDTPMEEGLANRIDGFVDVLINTRGIEKTFVLLDKLTEKLGAMLTEDLDKASPYLAKTVRSLHNYFDTYLHNAQLDSHVFGAAIGSCDKCPETKACPDGSTVKCGCVMGACMCQMCYLHTTLEIETE